MRLFHVSPTCHRRAIAAEGLDPAKCREPRGRVWFYADERRAKAHAGWPHHSDVWCLEDDEFIVLHSCWTTPWDDEACYVTVVVPPELLTRLEPSPDDEVRHASPLPATIQP